MIGAGTGVAPYRSFLYEREAREAKGNSWLFFGEQRFQSDFLYQTDWQHFLKNGTLEHMNVAFSRDQQEKIYIQDKLLEESEKVFEWIEQGATLYVCGDIDRLAQGVHDTLIKIISKHSGLDDEGVNNYIDQLKINKKYQRDEHYSLTSTPVEIAKDKGNYLRGTLVETFADQITGSIPADDTYLIKFPRYLSARR
ncbi:Sulfite reductase [NADPH] flavoprotein alpha-component [Nymphon striatum]|nr:Sulfite reductase [NADPH] flavoprotein alpha-component [Nymphon striatum]